MNISASHLSFAYDEQGPLILKDLSCEFKQEDITLLDGNTGEGKSTFLYLAAGLYPHYAGVLKEGTVLVDGKDPGKMDPSERCHYVGMMFQNPDLQFCMDTVRNEMIFCLENLQEKKENFEQKIKEALAFCGISHLENRKLMILSGGEKQKTALACLWLLRPKWLLLDESFASIDQASRHDLVQKLMQMHRQYGTGIVAVDHHPENWLGAATSVCHMRNGQIFPGNLQDLNPELVPYMADTGRNHIGDVVLQMQDVSVWHQDEQHPVIDHVNLTLRQGGSYAILGESGSGKSTLFGAVFGLYPYHGKILFPDKEIKKMRRHLAGQIGMITQSPQDQFIGGTVRDEIEAGMNKDNNDDAQKILREIHLWKYRDVSPYLLSQGQQRRLGAAAMMNSRCRLLLCDEPTCAQDPQSAYTIMTNLLQEARAKHIALVFSTHEQELAKVFADEIWMIKDHTLVRKEIR